MGKFVLETDVVSTHADNFNDVASQMRDMANKIASYDVGDCEEFNFAGAVAAIAANVSAAAEKMTNTSKYLSTVVETHTSLQGSMVFTPGAASTSNSSSASTSTVAETAAVASEATTTASTTSETTEKATNSSYEVYQNLTDEQLRGIANQCAHEQGDAAGIAAEASLMANRYELYGKGSYNNIADYVRDSTWWARSESNFANSSEVSDENLAIVKDVLVNGNRTLPDYIDEHDCESDLSSISTGDINSRSDYVQSETQINNKYGASYTFYSFPSKYSDPFGYTATAYNKRNGN